MSSVTNIGDIACSMSDADDIGGIVGSQIEAVNAIGGQAVEAAMTAIGAMGAGFDGVEGIDPGTVDPPTFEGTMDLQVDFSPNTGSLGGGTSRSNPIGDHDVGFTETPIVTKEIEDFNEVAPTVTIPPKNFTVPRPLAPYGGVEQFVSLPAAPEIDTNQILADIRNMIGGLTVPTTVPAYRAVDFNDVSTGVHLDALSGYQQKLFTYVEGLTDTELTDYLLADIILSLQSGGRGLDGDTENAIYTRAADRINDEYVAEYNRAEAQLAASGWIIPTGSQIAHMHELAAKHLRAKEQLNYEVMIENARLALQDRQGAREVSVRFEQVYREYISGYYGRYLEAQKQLVAENVSLYGLAVEHNKLVLNELEARVELYKAFLQSALMEIEAFEKQMGLYKIQAEIRGQDAAILTSWISASLASVQVYEAQIKAVSAVVENNKLSVEVYGEKAKAYAAEVQAYATQIGAWSAELDGNMKQIDAYKAKSEAYAARAQAVESMNKIEIAKGEIDLKKAEIAIQKFSAMVQERLAELQIQAEQTKIQATVIAAQGNIAVARIGAQGEAYKAQVAVSKTISDTNIARASMTLEANRANAANALAQAQIRTQAMIGAAQAASALAASALSAVNVGATLSKGFSRSSTHSCSQSKSLNNTLMETIKG